tara:strand:+ start:5294 stop:5515 length:222 start_codon:yes stop_codon:yes gene_type:complete
MKLSNQAIGAIMMALQNSLMEQSDIVPVLKNFDLVKSDNTNRWGTKSGEVNVENPPVVRVGNTNQNKFEVEDL